MNNFLIKITALSIVLSLTSCVENVKKSDDDMKIKLSTKDMTPNEAFLVENMLKTGVVTTKSGLQYKVVTEGKGAKPIASDSVKVHYRGTLIDGTEFDSSYKRNEPISFPLSGVIKGWTEGLQLMTVGSKYMLYIPAELAYGKKAVGGVIAPNSTLIFEVELLGINVN